MTAVNTVVTTLVTASQGANFANGFWLPSLRGGGALPTRLNILMVGQSQAARLITAQSGAGKTALIAEAQSIGYTTVNVINGAADSIGILYEAGEHKNPSVKAYLASGNLTEGAAFADLVTAVTGSGIAWADIDWVVYGGQGETDRLAIQESTESGVDKADLKAGFKKLIELVAARATNAKHLLSPCIGNTGLSTSAAKLAWTEVKEVYDEILDEDSTLKEGAGVWDEGRDDFQHRSQAGNELWGERLARTMAHYDGYTIVNPLGAQMTAASYDASVDELLITVTHDGGADFTISEPDGFGIYIGGTRQTNATTAARVDANTIKLSGGLSFTAGDVVTLSFPVDTSSDMTIANIFKDNATNDLPLRPNFGMSVTDNSPPGFSPDDLAELNFWVDPSDASSVTTSGGNATVLDDKSGGTDMTAVSAAAYGSRTINSLNVLDFDKGENYTVNIDYTSGHILFFVIEFDDNTTVNYIRDADNAGTIRSYLSSSSNVVLDMDNYNITGSSALSTGTPYIIVLEADTTNGCKIYVDGGTVEASNGSDPGLSTNMNVIGGTSFGFDGAIGEFIGYEYGLTTSEMNQVGNYLADKWGTTWTDIT